MASFSIFFVSFFNGLKINRDAVISSSKREKNEPTRGRERERWRRKDIDGPLVVVRVVIACPAVGILCDHNKSRTTLHNWSLVFLSPIQNAQALRIDPDKVDGLPFQPPHTHRERKDKAGGPDPSRESDIRPSPYKWLLCGPEGFIEWDL